MLLLQLLLCILYIYCLSALIVYRTWLVALSLLVAVQCDSWHQHATDELTDFYSTAALRSSAGTA
jgi:hypothetical protein